MSGRSLQARNTALAEKLSKKLGLGGADLATKLRKAGRRLPRRLRREGLYLAQAAQIETHPKLARQIDLVRIDKAYRALDTHLDRIDPADRRWGWFLGVLGALSFNLLLFSGLVVAVLAWRGLIGGG